MRERQARVVLAEDLADRKDAAEPPRRLTVARRRGGSSKLILHSAVASAVAVHLAVDTLRRLQKPRHHHRRGFVFLGGSV